MKRITVPLLFLLILFAACNNHISVQNIENDNNINADSLLLINQYNDSLINIIYDNFYKYRNEDSLFVGTSIGFPAIDSLFVLNFEKGTIRKVKISDTVDFNYFENLSDNRKVGCRNYSTFLFLKYANYIKGFPTIQEITGDFNGDGKIDSLKLHDWINDESIYSVSDVIFSFSDKKIPKLKICSNFDYTIKNEGDLDGDGADEIGFLYGWGSSSCRIYRVYTLKNNRWKIMAEIESTLDMRIAGILPIEKDPNNASVLLVREPGKYANCSSCCYVVEKCVKVKDIVLQKVK